MSGLVDIDVLRKLLSYNPETGVLTWRERPREFFSDDHGHYSWNKRFAQKRAGSINGNGYDQVQILGKNYTSHRVAWAIFYGSWPKGQIDHINRDRLDNRIKNLRDVTHAENMKNKKIRSDNLSGVTGVTFNDRNKKWRAVIRSSKCSRHLGYFTDINDAIAARKAAEKEYGFHQNHGRQEMLR